MRLAIIRLWSFDSMTVAEIDALDQSGAQLLLVLFSNSHQMKVVLRKLRARKARSLA
jgi:hypothetical protein